VAILHVRNVPDSLYSALRERAAAEGRSLSAEVVLLLEESLRRPPRTAREILDAIERRRRAYPLPPGLPDSTELLREDRSR
jgi:plasmid stability protein